AQPLVLQAGTFEQQSHLFVPVDQHTQVIDVPQAEPLRQVCQTFVDCVLTQQQPTSNGQLAAQLVSVLEACSRSLQRHGDWIEVDP
ncbi:MAG: gfo/Idh/MocA family oxidoreductase, partial [Cyanobacteria bacterium P01_H01_bin.121]